ncbi:MAG TPA: hypothetical protein VK103_01580, partial [Bacillota bacterium]|nr:hypothetical protein [Bacillota bacterium]
RRSTCRLSRRRVLGVAATSTALGLVGCRTASEPEPAVDNATVDRLLATWATAVRGHDRTAHDRVWSAAAPEVSGRLADSLFGIELTEFSARRVPGSLTTPRGAWLVEVTWGLPGDGPQHHRVLVSAHRVADGIALAPAGGDTPDGTDDTGVPMWWVQVAVAVTGERAGLLTGVTDTRQPWAGESLQTWLDRAERAVVAVEQRAGRSLGEDRRTWFELPGSSEVAAQIVGNDGLGAVAALATAVGGSVADSPAPVHVVLDPPRVGALSATGALGLLTHEAVHVATRAPYTDLPVWVEEGWADVVAWADDDPAGWQQAGPLLARIRDGDDVITVPTDEAFAATDEAELGVAYALAWSLCRWMLRQAERRGDPDGGWESLRRWYDLQAPDDGSSGMTETKACETVFELEPPTREQHWRDWLVARAERR